MDFIDHPSHSEDARQFLRANPDCSPAGNLPDGSPGFLCDVGKRYLAWLFQHRDDVSFDLTVFFSKLLVRAGHQMKADGALPEDSTMSLSYIDDVAALDWPEPPISDVSEVVIRTEFVELSDNVKQFLAENPDCVSTEIFEPTGEPWFPLNVCLRYAEWLCERFVTDSEFVACQRERASMRISSWNPRPLPCQ